MRDKISIPIVEALHPKIRDEVKSTIDQAENKLGQYTAVRITQGGRTFAESDHLYQIGRTIKGANARPGKPMGDIVSNSKAGQSYHNYFLALDFCVLYDKDKNGTFESISWNLLSDMDKDGESDWMEVVKIFKAAGYTWGGQWLSIKDNPHFEKTFGHNWRDLLVKYDNKQFIPGTTYLNI
jgi:peptidoglycan L-alanyl-D-glutamate endopeptidase CwlK